MLFEIGKNGFGAFNLDGFGVGKQGKGCSEFVVVTAGESAVAHEDDVFVGIGVAHVMRDLTLAATNGSDVDRDGTAH